MINGRVIKGVSSKFSVDVDGKILICFARGKLKKEGEIRVGDFVELSCDNNQYIIEKVLPRKNALIRPYVANVDICFIVIAPLPTPDFKLVDKIIINAIDNNITPVIVLNKDDILEEAIKESVINDYKKICDVIVTSAVTGEGIDALLKIAKKKVACFAGQSAVGKSSLINNILGENYLQTGSLSAKIERGKHTTRQSQLFIINDSYFIDTCGFSMLDFALDFMPGQLSSYYYEFAEFAGDCKFRNGCTHISEPNCAVKNAVERGLISRSRYDRYVELFEELNERWRKRYD